MRCPYCNQDREEDKFSDEHVIPRSIGGNLQPTNPFKIRVCMICNARSGTSVDGPFIKSWYLQNAKALTMSDHYDPSVEPILQMVYGGRLDEWLEERTECEMWIGPIGESIYHIHLPHPNTGMYAGGPPNISKKKLNPGFVFSNLLTDDKTYSDIYVKSLQKNFPDSPIAYLNVQGPEGQCPYPVIPERLRKYFDFVRRLNGEQHKLHIEIDKFAPSRFSVKLALGLGIALLGGEYASSDYAQTLRNALWENDTKKLQHQKVKGVPFFSDRRQSIPLFSWKGGHSLLLMPFKGKGLVTCFYFFGTGPLSITITDDDKYFDGKVPPDGWIYLISPGLRRYVGPIPTENYIGNVLGSFPDRQIQDFETTIASCPRFPKPNRTHAQS